MARIESIAKAGYYPTPPRVTDIILKGLYRPYGGRHAKKGARLLDPCCGQGEALHSLAKKAQSAGALVTTYGVELSQQRARAARPIIDHVLNSDFFHTTIAHDAFDILWLNPPYDLETPDSAVRRSETAYLQRATPYLKREFGLLIFLIPQNALADCASTLSREYHRVTCLRFPEPEFQNFGQVVVTGYRNTQPMPDPNLTQLLRNIAWGIHETHTLSAPPDSWRLSLPAHGHDPQDILFASQQIDLNLALAEAAQRGILASPTVRQRFWPTQKLTSRPVLPLRQGHIALMTAAGFLDNQVLHGRNGQDDLIIKGRTYKESVLTKSQPNSSTETEVMRTTIRSLNLRTGERRDIKP